MAATLKQSVRRWGNGLYYGTLRSLIPLIPRRKKRSLWMGDPIVSMANNMKAERLLGIDADSLVYDTYFITEQFTYNLNRWLRLPILGRYIPKLVLAWACARYSRFHFYCNQGMIPSQQRGQFVEQELSLLKALGKEVFFWTYGADVRSQQRTRALGEYNCCFECPTPGSACICDDQAQNDNIEKLRNYSTGLFSMGDMSEYPPGSRNDLFFWPLDMAESPEKYQPVYPDETSTKPLFIDHAPNHREFKGTRFLQAAVERLQGAGHNIELELVERVPNEKALEIYRSADIIFDQCLIGFHGFFAIEAMALGKPVVCYIRKPNEYLIEPENCPIVSARADQVYEVLLDLVSERSHLAKLGRRGRAYVEKHFTLEAFADRLAKTYRDIGLEAA